MTRQAGPAAPLTRRKLVRSAGLLTAGLLGSAHAAVSIADTPPLDLPIEPGAMLGVVRPLALVGPDAAAFDRNSKRFAAMHGIGVRVEYVGWDDLRARTALIAETDAGADVVVGWAADPHLYADKLLDMTRVAEYLGAKYGGWHALAERYGGSASTGRWIAIPMGACGSPAVYRQSWVREAGYDRVPTDVDQFLALCRKLKALGHPAAFTTGHAVGDANAYCHWLIWAFGGAMVDADRHVTINSKATLEALRYGRALYKTFAPGTQSWLDPANNKAFLAGEIGLTQNAVSLYYAAKNASDPRLAAMADDIDHARMPIGPVGHPTELALAISAMAFKHTRYPNAAKAYLAHMMEAPQYEPWLNESLGYWGQPLRAYAASDLWVSDPKLGAYRQTMQDSLWPGYPGTVCEASVATLADYVMVDMVAAVNRGDSTPEVAAGEAERRARRYYPA